MISRRSILERAVDECYKELYSLAQPPVTWEEFIELNKNYDKNSKEPYPFQFYYIPEEIYKEIIDDYVYAYNMKSRFDDHIEVLCNYFEDPIRDKIIHEGEESYRGYEHFTPLKDIIGEENYQKVVDYINEAKNFYRFDTELNSFRMTMAMGCSPNSNKQAVIDNWKKYRGIDITIDESIYNEE